MTSGFTEKTRRRGLGFPRLRLVIDEREVDIVILRLSPNTESTRLEAWKQHTHKLTEASGVKHGDPFCCTSTGVVRIHTSTRHRSLACGAYRIDPTAGQYVLVSLMDQDCIPEHGKDLPCPF